LGMFYVKQRSFVTLSLAGLCRTVTGADLEEERHKKGDMLHLATQSMLRLYGVIGSCMNYGYRVLLE
jgi:hypothetical protein